jgi:hypothetical protein
MTLGANTTGMTIGKTGTTTTVNGTLSTGTIDNSGNTMTLGANTTGMTIGKTGTTTTVNGTLSAVTIDNSGNTMVLGANTTGMTIGKTGITTVNGTLDTATIDRTGLISIGGNVTRTSNINIMTGSSATGNINIMTGLSPTGDVNISNGLSASGTISLGGGTSVVKINRPLTLNYNPTALSESQLGYKITPTFTGANPNYSTVNLAYATLTPGVWIINGNSAFLTPGANGLIGLSISPSSNALDYTCMSFMTTPYNNTLVTNVTRIVRVTTSATWHLTAFTVTSCSMSNIVFDIYRMA